MDWKNVTLEEVNSRVFSFFCINADLIIAKVHNLTPGDVLQAFFGQHDFFSEKRLTLGSLA